MDGFCSSRICLGVYLIVCYIIISLPVSNLMKILDFGIPILSRNEANSVFCLDNSFCLLKIILCIPKKRRLIEAPTNNSVRLLVGVGT